MHKKNLLLKLGIEPNKVYFFEVINSEQNFEDNDTIRKLMNQKIIILWKSFARSSEFDAMVPTDLNLLEQKMEEKKSYQSENKNAFFEELKKMIKENL